MYLKPITSVPLRGSIAVTLACLLGACASVKAPHYPADTVAHILPVKPDGRLSPIANVIADEDVVARVPKANTEPLKAIDEALSKEIAEAKAQGREAKHVLLYIHGGLNPRKESLQRAADLLSDPHGLSADYFPIFVNWQSDYFSTYGDYLTKIWQGEEGHWKWVWWIKAPVYFATDLAKSVVGAPKSWLDQAMHLGQSSTNDWGSEQPESDLDRNDQSVRLSAPSSNFDYQCQSSRKSPGVLTELARVLTTPAVVEFGRPAWNMMLRRTRTLFWTSDKLALKPRRGEHDAQSNPRDQCEGCGGLNVLLKYLEKKQKSHHLHITLIGHSMGAIVANQVVAEVPKLKFDNIVHMASADSVDNTFALTFDYMRTSTGKATQFYALMLQGDNENWEVSGGGFVPRGSLLAWIDNMFTDPATSRSRCAGRWSNMERFVLQIPRDIAPRVHLTVFAKSASGHPMNHGDFSQCQFWTEAFWSGTAPKSARR